MNISKFGFKHLAFTALALALLAGVPASTAMAHKGKAAKAAADNYANLPSTMKFNAIIRDFKPKGVSGGHADFESYGNSYITTGLINDTLDSENKPVFKTKRGQQITTEYKNSAGQPINPKHYDASKGDTAGAMSTVGSDQLTSSTAFAQWYRDVPSVNVSKVQQLTFNRVANTNRYVFDSANDEPYKSRNGFFPIDGELMGNQGSTGHNFCFTTEIVTEFVFEKNKGHVFTFTGDDDVWVFIDNKLVLDLGGLHPKKTQTLQLDRLTNLVDGQTYSLRVFHAERHTNESNFRIETTLTLKSAELPAVSSLAD